MSYEDIKKDLKIIRSIIDNPNIKGKTVAELVNDVTEKYPTKNIFEYVNNELYKGNDRWFREQIASDILKLRLSDTIIGNPVTESDKEIHEKVSNISVSDGYSMEAAINDALDEFSIDELYDYNVNVLCFSRGDDLSLRFRLEENICNNEISKAKARTDMSYKILLENDVYNVLSIEDIRKNDSKDNDYYAVDDKGKLYESKYSIDFKTMFNNIPSGTNIVGYVIKDEIDNVPVQEQKILITDPKNDYQKINESEININEQNTELPENTKENTKSNLTKTRKQLADIFIEALKSDEPLSWKKGWAGMGVPKNAISEKKYKGVNKMLLGFVAMEKRYEDPRWCTFKQANEKGWKIKKGEKGVPVEFWSFYDKLTKRNITPDEYNSLLKNDPEYKENIKLVSRTYTVFNGEQIEGIPEIEKVESNIELVSELEEFVDNVKDGMDIEIIYGGDRACYIPSLDEVHIPMPEYFYSEYEFYATELHELAHATGASARLNRDLEGTFGSKSYAKEELRAEIASCFLSNELGIPDAENSEHDKNHIAYVKSWIQKIEDEPAELMRAIKDAEKITDYIKEKGKYDLVINKRQDIETAKEQKNISQSKKMMMLGKAR